MSKKALIGFWIGTACLTLACLCCPANILPFVGRIPTRVPSRPAPTAITPPTSFVQPTLSAEDIPVCVNNLARILHESENVYYPGLEMEGDFTLVTYTVSGDTISDPVNVSPIAENLRSYQQDTASQAALWRFVTEIIPADQRTLVTRFVIFTDGVNNLLGAVEQTDDPHYWMLEMDIEDSRNFPYLSTTLVHEFAHILTLNDSQVKTNFPVFDNPDNQTIYEREAANCPTYFMYEGCSYDNSYINTFFGRFWTNVYDEWSTINTETDQDILDRKLDSFYQEYADQFVSSYAVTSPEEDIAESFMYFIFTPRPSGTDIAGQKVLFFYDYPEMVTLRERILANLCTYADNP